MANPRSDSCKIEIGLMVLVLAGAMTASGCAGLIMGSNPSGANVTPGSSTPPPTNASQPQLVAAPMNASFPGVAIGGSSSQTVTLQNVGNADLSISSASLTGQGLSMSGLTLPATIPAGQTMPFNLVFAPNAAGNYSGSVTITSNAPNSPLLITASGSATSPTTALSASTSSLNFGTVALGSTSTLGVTFTNSGNTNLSISGVMLTGTGFSANGVSANMTITPGQTAAMTVMFTPTVVGAATGAISVTSNAGVMSISLGGSGGQLSSHTVALSWLPSTSQVVGYFVYRVLADGSLAKLNPAPAVLTDFTDASVVSGQTYTYVVTAVTADNVESDPSDPVVATIP